MLFPRLSAENVADDHGPAMHFGAHRLTYAELADVVGGLVPSLARANRVAVWATPTVETAIAVLAALYTGAAVVPLNPKIGERELAHILSDSEPDLVLAAASDVLPAALALQRVDVSTSPSGASLPPEPVDDELPAFIVYTSGTTGPPKGVVHARRAVGSNLDALAAAWQWTERDTVVHALPLFHVHGLIVGVLGPLRRGGVVRHVGRFDVRAVAAELSGNTMFFGVPTMYSRVAAEVATAPELAEAIGRARLLVSGSAGLPVSVHERITAATGQRVVERYGLTETLMNTAVRADGERPMGTVGPALDGVDVRLVDESGAELTGHGEDVVGEIEVRGPNLFLGYLNRPDATEAAFRDGWFRTGDVGMWTADGQMRIVGRRATDLIKSGGYKIGAGEIENVLSEHPGVVEVAVTGEPDADLGERIVAWVVARQPAPDPDELAELVAGQLAPHKRPRVVRFVEALPRNEMGKVLKRQLGATG
ncbi:MAG TPA: acyl-CoA synthetase [Pseudonocardiaceae bacterium]|jgi:malonyl-CoA/methylmalonyl-CoA synthetase|nr:acyl-CoA synthetase [Pseudonocardiaceae bacterium]